MSHVRKQIRDHVATALAGIATVYKTRAWPIAEQSLPALLVYTNNEETEITDLWKLQRNLQVVVEAIAQATAADESVDALIASVEAAIGADITLGGLAMDCILSAIEVSVSVEGSAPIGRARMTYVARYRTTFNDPETPL